MKIKRCTAWLLVFMIILTSAGSIAFAQNDSSELPSYNAYDDFSVSKNPNGVWSYQYLANGTYTNLSSDGKRWGSDAEGKLQLTDSDLVTGKKAIYIHAEKTTKDVVLTFTAPKSGKVNVLMANGGVFAPQTTSGSGELAFTLKQNDTVIKSKDNLDSAVNHTDRFFADTVELTVKKGDTLRFIVHRNKYTTTPNAYFNPSIAYMEVSEEKEEETLPDYNAYNDFSKSNNPNGVWSYQYLANGTYTNLTSDGTRWGSDAEGKLQLTDSDLVTGKKAVYVRPEKPEKDVVITFKVPTSGLIDISMANGGVFSPHQSVDEMSFIVKHNDTVIKSVSDLDSSYSSAQNRVLGIGIERKVNVGDEIHFIVHRNKQAADPRVYFNPAIKYVAIGDDVLGFPSDSEIRVTDVTADTISISWPTAMGGMGTYSYKVFCSENPIVEPKMEDGINVNGNSYTFTDLKYNKYYYFAVLVNDGESTIFMPTSDKIQFSMKNLSFNAYDDFSTSKNPNGVWSYQYLLNGTYTNLTSDGTRWGSDAEGKLQLTDSDLVTGKKAVYVRPEKPEKDVVITFKAPTSGLIDISMANGGVFSPHQSVDEMSFIVKHNDTVIKSVSDLDSSYSSAQNRFFGTGMERKVKAGDEIHFIVHRNKQAADPRVYFNPSIKYVAIGNDVLGFSSNSEIKVTEMTLNTITISWPKATGGTGNYSYKVFCSDKPIANDVLENGVDVTNNTFSFTGLEYGNYYYFAVLVDDGESTLLLPAADKIQLYLDILSFDAYNDYSEYVQNGVWSYYYTDAGNMKLKELSWKEEKWGDATLGSVTKADSDLVTGHSSLHVKPGTDTDVVVVFTAPYSGKINLSMANGGIFVPYNGAGDKFDGINFKMLYNDTKKVSYSGVSSKNSHPKEKDPKTYVGRVFTDKYVMNVQKGDKFYFVVNKNKVLNNDNTYFNPHIEYISVDESTFDLKFVENRSIDAVEITKSSMRVVWPKAVGGTGKYIYKLYIDTKPIKNIPKTGGIEFDNQTTYQMKNLPAYTDYYFAVTVSDGKNTIWLTSKEALSTIGNVYSFNSVEDYQEIMQPINTPWRYYYNDTKTGKTEKLEWNAVTKMYGDVTTPKLSYVSSDMVTGKPALSLGPQKDKEAVVAFIAPFSGKITVSLANRAVFCPYNGEAQKYDGINFTFLLNEKVIYSKKSVSAKNNQDDRCFAGDTYLDVSAGDILYFIVNANNNQSEDRTFLAPQIEYTYVNKGSDEFGFLPGATVQTAGIGTNEFTLNWSAAFSPIKDNITYDVWISTSKITKKPSTKPIYSGKNTSTVCKNLKKVTKYYVYVLATNSSNKTSVLNPDLTVNTEYPIFDAYLQYPSVDNTAGVWNYVVRSWNSKEEKYEYTLMKKDEQTGKWGNPTAGQVSIADSDPVTAKPAMVLHPGTKKKDACVAFTAPYSGEIQIVMNNGGIFAPYNGKDQAYDGINFFAYLNDKEIWSKEAISSKNLLVEDWVGTGTIRLTVTQGDKLFFVVSANKNIEADSTYFNPYIKYLNVTGGTGVINDLEGFIIPEPEIKPSYRSNNLTDTSGKSVSYINTIKHNLLWISIVSYLGLSVAAVISLLLVNRKNTKYLGGNKK